MLRSVGRPWRSAAAFAAVSTSCGRRCRGHAAARRDRNRRAMWREAHDGGAPVYTGAPVPGLPMQALLDVIATLPRPSGPGRFFHGRGGLFPGCEQWALDVYPPVWVLTSFAPVNDEDLARIGAALAARWAGGAPGGAPG